MTYDEIEAAIARNPSVKAAARELGVPETTLRRKRRKLDPAIAQTMEQAGTKLVPSVVWLKEKGYSILLRPPAATTEDLRGLIEKSLLEQRKESFKSYPHRPASGGTNLLVVDLADVHVGKLCVESEVGYHYDRDRAIHRMVEGTRTLLAKARGHEVGRILLILGNDILHTDNARGQTTSGTPQDTSGSIYQMYSGALLGYIQVAEMLAEHAPVDLLYVPSNHDQLMGWALSGAVALALKNHPRVSSSDYNLSALSRKYYRFEKNLIGLTHGHGEKEKDLYSLMMTEARAHVTACGHRYWYRHHTHHKSRSRGGVEREKDHIGMTIMSSGNQLLEGDVEIEVVRSPSPPDNWHSLHGYVNRQAVECFIHHPLEGQTARFTAWF